MHAWCSIKHAIILAYHNTGKAARAAHACGAGDGSRCASWSCTSLAGSSSPDTS